jgi:hypothetical protein
LVNLEDFLPATIAEQVRDLQQQKILLSRRAGPGGGGCSAGGRAVRPTRPWGRT